MMQMKITDIFYDTPVGNLVITHALLHPGALANF